MPTTKAVLLTGATGFLGGRLLCELLAGGHQVVVLARDKGRVSAKDRVRANIQFWQSDFNCRLIEPEILSFDLRDGHTGLSPADVNYLGRKCRSVIHGAASLAFRPGFSGEPWKTNVGGTSKLLDTCRRAGIADWHQISTAFVCGRAEGPVLPEEIAGQSPSLFRNVYEESKARAEVLVREAEWVRGTIHRPSIIVGDHGSGKTNGFSGLYKFLELGIRLGAQHQGGDGGRVREIPIRLPLVGQESWNLVPVDWVARVVAAIYRNDGLRGGVHHLVSPQPVPVKALISAGARVLGVHGIQLANAGGKSEATPLENSFLDACGEYWPYLGGNPEFASSELAHALPGVPCPAWENEALDRLFRYALDARWWKLLGEKDHGRQEGSVDRRLREQAEFDAVLHVEKVLPELVLRRGVLKGWSQSLAVVLTVAGPGGGFWLLRLGGNPLIRVEKIPGEIPAGEAAVRFTLNMGTLKDLVGGRITPQEAFFAKKISIAGDMERGMLLGGLVGYLLSGNKDSPADLSGLQAGRRP